MPSNVLNAVLIGTEITLVHFIAVFNSLTMLYNLQCRHLRSSQLTHQLVQRTTRTSLAVDKRQGKKKTEKGKRPWKKPEKPGKVVFFKILCIRAFYRRTSNHLLLDSYYVLSTVECRHVYYRAQSFGARSQKKRPALL